MEPVIQELIALLQIGASSGDERAVADALRSKLEEIGFTVTEDDAGSRLVEKCGIKGNCGNLIAVLEGGAPGSILFTSHMDRVANGYNIHPQLHEDGLLTSDGTTILAADDLSGAMAIVEGVRRVKASGKPFPRVEVVFCIAEEAGLWGSHLLDSSSLQSKIGYALDSPGRLGRIISGAPCRACLSCEVFGKPAHAGVSPELGVNAVTALGKVLANLRDGRLDEDTTANFAFLSHGCQSINIVQEYAKVEGEARSAHQEKLEAYIEYFHAYCRKAVEGTGATVKTHAEIGFESFNISDEQPTVRLAKQVFQDMGIPSVAERLGGGMDANNLNSRGIECVGLATGYDKNHTIHETLNTKDFVGACEAVERLIWAYAATV